MARPRATSKSELRFRPPNSWIVQVFLGRDESGKQRFKSRTIKGLNNAAGRRAAERELDKLRHDVLSGLVAIPAKDQRAGRAMTLPELLDDYRRVNALARRTDDNYRLTAEALRSDPIGSVTIGSLTGRHLDEYYRRRVHRRTGAAVQSVTVNTAHKTIRAALNRAVKYRWLDHSPAADATPPKPVEHESYKPTAAEVRMLMDAAPPMLAAIIRVSAAAGTRRGETLGGWCLS